MRRRRRSNWAFDTQCGLKKSCLRCCWMRAPHEAGRRKPCWRAMGLVEVRLPACQAGFRGLKTCLDSCSAAFCMPCALRPKHLVAAACTGPPAALPAGLCAVCRGPPVCSAPARGAGTGQLPGAPAPAAAAGSRARFLQQHQAPAAEVRSTVRSCCAVRLKTRVRQPACGHSLGWLNTPSAALPCLSACLCPAGQRPQRHCFFRPWRPLC